MPEFVARDIERHTLPLPDNVVLPNTTRVVLDYNRHCSVDFGALCYLKRNTTRKRGKGRQVDLKSLSITRTAEVTKLIELSRRHWNDSSRSPSTHFNYYRDLARYLDWCDINCHQDVLSSPEAARKTLRAWATEMNRLIAAGHENTNTIYAIQFATVVILQDYFEVYDLGAGINLVRWDKTAATPTPIPSEEAIARNLAFAICIFNGFCDLVLEQRPYPFLLKMPAFLEWPGDAVWVFPFWHWRITPEQATNRAALGSKANVPDAADYVTGRIRSEAEVRLLTPQRLWARVPGKVLHTLHTLDAANVDAHHIRRLQRGEMAMQAFFIMFLAATGSNLSQALNMPWSEELDALDLSTTPTRQNFRDVKYRAGGKVVTFQIALRFLPFLKCFLKLCRHLLRGERWDYLFFKFEARNQYKCKGDNGADLSTSQLTRVTDNWEYEYYRVITVMTAKVPRVSPMQLRSAKQDFLIRTEDPITTARVMQHSLRTTLQKYSSGSPETAKNEMGDYLAQVERMVLEKGEEPAGSQPRSLGVCVKPDNPRALEIVAPVAPNCTRQEGCLYCENYRVHADETDVRRLLSFHYCLCETARFAESAEQHKAVFGHILARIESILSTIALRKSEMSDAIKRIRHEVVVEGALDPYWAVKLEFLMALDEI